MFKIQNKGEKVNKVIKNIFLLISVLLELFWVN